MPHHLHLYQDTLPARERAALVAPGPRAVYVVGGDVVLGSEALAADEGALADGPGILQAGDAGATCWRFELTPHATGDDRLPVPDSTLLLSAALDDVNLDDDGSWLLRLDSVAFPPGGCALLHTHQGPGIRCLLEGSIRIDAEGHSTQYRPGDAWFERGPDAVFAAADAQRPSRFIRALVLPARLRGRSSIRYLRDEDRDAPKSQSYRVYGEYAVPARSA